MAPTCLGLNPRALGVGLGQIQTGTVVHMPLRQLALPRDSTSPSSVSLSAHGDSNSPCVLGLCEDLVSVQSAGTLDECARHRVRDILHGCGLPFILKLVGEFKIQRSSRNCSEQRLVPLLPLPSVYFSAKESPRNSSE